VFSLIERGAHWSVPGLNRASTAYANHTPAAKSRRCEDVWYTWKSGRESSHASHRRRVDITPTRVAQAHLHASILNVHNNCPPGPCEQRRSGNYALEACRCNSLSSPGKGVPGGNWAVVAGGHLTVHAQFLYIPKQVPGKVASGPGRSR